jgi:hypothetical protein
MAANEISRAQGNTVVILCSEVIYLLTLIYGILYKTKSCNNKREKFFYVVPNLTARWRWHFFFIILDFFFILVALSARHTFRCAIDRFYPICLLTVVIMFPFFQMLRENSIFVRSIAID